MTQAKTITVALVAFDRRIHLLKVVGAETATMTLCYRGVKNQTPFGGRILDEAHLAVLRGDAESYCRLCVAQAGHLAGL
jgi:hypothetical protein